ncbi:nuclease-related domain-containing DEAD/DEAH box helicase [Psychrobacter sp. UBA6291]|uniref:nuclease-related domain-containing DEAD/DEAH box helicase n=1 Tax=Psychrobacter sp. UBA6291 TaxID=1947357 RepID=UPI00257C3A45|nr:NERD domain-containing protein [Psychrobacter sp. UBA6291]
MKMVPNTAYPSTSKAELKIFERLSEAFKLLGDESYYALHSLNLTHHEYKRFGEIDFLLVCPYGIYVLEIKGGRVSCSDGKWHFTDRLNNTDSRFESPFRQAQTALHGIYDKLKDNLPVAVIEQFVIGYGVVLPECHLSSIGAEWDVEILCESQSCRHLEAWLKKLFTYWMQKDSKPLADKQAVVQVVDYLRPSFDSLMDTAQRLDDSTHSSARLADTQMQLSAIMVANPKVICSGGAGTGKTSMAIYLAMHWASLGYKTALVCFSPWLQGYLRRQHMHPNLIIQTARSLESMMSRKPLSIKILIVDEAHDLMTDEAFKFFDRLLEGGLKQGRWYLFMDINHQSGLCGQTNISVLESFQCHNPVQIPLTTNYRYTTQILQTIKERLNADMGVTGAANGLPVIEQQFNDIDELIGQVGRDIDKLVHSQMIDPYQITILLSSNWLSSSMTYSESLNDCSDIYSGIERQVLSKLSKICPIIRVDSYSITTFPPKSISLLKVSEFKGLENDVVFFLGQYNEFENRQNEAYVAMSRAKSLLYVYEIINK